MKKHTEDGAKPPRQTKSVRPNSGGEARDSSRGGASRGGDSRGSQSRDRGDSRGGQSRDRSESRGGDSRGGASRGGDSRGYGGQSRDRNESRGGPSRGGDSRGYGGQSRDRNESRGGASRGGDSRGYGDKPRYNDRPRERSEARDGGKPRYNDRPRERSEARDGDRPRYNDRPRERSEARDGDRPSYNDRPRERSDTRDGDRPRYNDRPRERSEARDGGKPRYNDRPRERSDTRDGDKPRYNDRPRERSEARDGGKPRYNDRPRERSEARDGGKPRYNDRPRERSDTRDGGKPRYNDRPRERSDTRDGDRPRYNDRPRERSDTRDGGKPRYNDRPRERSEARDGGKPRYNDRPRERSDARDGDRPRYSGQSRDGGEPRERPSRDRDSRSRDSRDRDSGSRNSGGRGESRGRSESRGGSEARGGGKKQSSNAGKDDKPTLALVSRHNEDLVLIPCRSGPLHIYIINNAHEFYAEHSLKEGDVVRAVLYPGSPRQKYGRGVLKAECIEKVSHIGDPSAIPLIVGEEYDLPSSFPEQVLAQAENSHPPHLLQDDPREDYRALPLVTIDGADARDFDDAVFAEPTPSGDMRLLVAIADVAHYVRPGSRLDAEARRRGFSCYLPQQVIPMLPEALSAGLCSLMPEEERYCVAIDMVISQDGALKSAQFARGLMKSHARLTYDQAQAIHEGREDHPLTAQLAHLYTVWEWLDAARQRRSVLNISLPEVVVTCDEQGEPKSCAHAKRLDSHCLIEDCMIMANRAAAQMLEKKSELCIYRVHDDPKSEALDDLAKMVRGLGLTLSKDEHPAAALQSLITHAGSRDDGEIIQALVLRACARARYATKDPGHFGLDLGAYTHFTSPIRRYADLIAHRLLLSSHGYESDAKIMPHVLDEICDDLLETEKRLQKAERSAKDRLIARLAEQHRGTDVSVRIEGMVSAGLFVTIQDEPLAGARGFVSSRKLPEDDWRMAPNRMTLQGRRSRIKLLVGALISVRIADISPANGEINCDWLSETP